MSGSSNIHNSAPIPVATNLNTNYNQKILFENIAISTGAIIITSLITILFYWVYQRDKYLFISLLCFLLFLYGLMNFGGFFLIQKKINQTFFRIYIGAATIIILSSVIVGLGFAVASSRKNKQASYDMS